MPTASGGGLYFAEEDKPAVFTVDVGRRKGDLGVEVRGMVNVLHILKFCCNNCLITCNSSFGSVSHSFQNRPRINPHILHISFMKIWTLKYFYNHSSSSADSRIVLSVSGERNIN